MSGWDKDDMGEGNGNGRVVSCRGEELPAKSSMKSCKNRIATTRVEKEEED